MQAAGLRLRVLLQRAHDVVAVQRQAAGGAAVAQHHWAQEHHQVGFVAVAVFASEQAAQQRQVAQAGYFVLLALEFVLQQAAEHDDGAVVDQHRRLNGAFVGDRSVRRCRLHAADFLEHGHFDAAVFADLRPHAQRQTDVFALYGLKRADGAVAGAGMGELAGDEGHVLADHDARFFVVQREQVGGGQDVGLAALLQKARQHAQHRAVVVAAGDADVEAWRRQRRGGAGLQRQVEDVGPAGAKVGPEQADQIAVFAAQLPLQADLGRFVGVDLDDQALHEDLGAARVKLIDDGAQLAKLRLGRADDERVGGRVGLNLAAGGGRGAGGQRRRGRAGCGGPSTRYAAARRWRASTRTRIGRQRGAQRGRQRHRVGVFQVDHVDVAAHVFRAGPVQPRHQ